MKVKCYKEQDHTFAFVLITRQFTKYFYFEWKEQNHPLYMQILNTVCGWSFIHDWEDKNYTYPIGKAVVMSDKIRQQVKELKEELVNRGENEHKKMVSDFYKTISFIADGETFFVYRLVYSMPTQNILLRIKTELEYINSGKTKDEADEWYDKYADTLFSEYDFMQYVNKKQGEGNKTTRVCRFCHRRTPDVTFKKIAHAIPESIGGHKNLICNEECDECNEMLGAEVESHLCNWFEFRRCQSGVKRKHGGVPNAYGRNYVIENQNISIFEKELNIDKMKAIGSNPVTLQKIYRALCKIAVDLIESEHLSRLQTTIDWVRKGRPKSSKYPQIAQMYHLCYVDKPHLYIFTRKDGVDRDNTPLHFCILRIFDLAFLYTLPHVDGRMLFTPPYTANINTEALKVLGLHQKWIWESYDTTALRNPHIELNFPESIYYTPLPPGEKGDPSKLRIEKEPMDRVDFNAPVISDKDIVKRSISEIHCNYHIGVEEIIQTIGSVSSECIFDVSARTPLFLRLKIKFKNMIKKKTVAGLTYEIYFSPNIYKNQFEYSESSIAVNQILIIRALELTLDSLFYDITKEHPEFLFTRENLSINNVGELLAEMKIVFVREGGIPFISIKGTNFWYSGYQ